MMRLLQIIMFTLLLGILAACDTAEDRSTSDSKGLISGDFVNDGYEKRAEGYDWVCVSITKKDDTTAHVSVRARADKKKPTCSFEADAFPMGSNRMKTAYEGKGILFILRGDTLEIAPEGEESQNLLYYFCSGGATLEGTYLRVDSLMDEEQLVWHTFQDTLSMQGITFELTALYKAGINVLTIKPVGLEIDNREVTHETNGWIVGAEVEDLNSDGSPEIVVYASGSDSLRTGSVICYSVNNGKSMSQVYFPGMTGNPEAMNGYRGSDEFAIVETTLVQRFPVYKTDETGNVTGEPTGMMRQIQYKLADGEASRYFGIDRIIEYPSPW